MTNWDKWQAYTEGLSSPQNYIEWSWLYTVAASLQRRVWLGPEHQPCFPNMYVILVGKPGIGKGLCIREVSDLLRFWPLEAFKGNENNGTLTNEEKSQIEMMVQSDLKHASEHEHQTRTKRQELTKPPLIPVCADAITYEALVEAVAASYRMINYTQYNEAKGKNDLKIYGHSSICFALQELASLMRKRTNDTVNYLLGLYDCPLDYEYVTKTNGKDRVRRGCLNLLAGTTPSFMQSTFDEKLMEEGFASRTFYVYAIKNRKNQFWIPPLTEEQRSHKKELLEHIKKLTTLYGQILIDQETKEFLQDWWNEQETNNNLRSNTSLKLIPYYSRKNIHTMKVAIAKHFSESTEMFIPLATFQWAIDFLGQEEKRMHLALTLEGTNPISKVTKKILELLGTGPKDVVTLLVETHYLTDRKGLEEGLEFLRDTDQIIDKQVDDPDIPDKVVIHWELRR